LELNGLQEVALLGLVGVGQELLDVGAHTGWRRISVRSLIVVLSTSLLQYQK
jgi:hypothetical protein